MRFTRSILTRRRKYEVFHFMCWENQGEFYRDAVAEYAKRLSRYGKLEILEVADEKTPDEPSEAQRLQILKKEGERLKKVLAKDAFHVALAIDGQKMDSVRFAARLEQLGVSGVSHVQFLIGGSLGLDQELLNGADLKLSFPT